MLRLNLLSPNQRQELEWERNRRFIIFISGVVFVFLTIFAVLLFCAKFYIDTQLSPLEEEIKQEKERTETKQVEEFRNKLEELDKKINNLATIQENQEKWSLVLEELSGLPLQGISFSTISISKTLRPASDKGSKEQEAVKEIKITGHADTRDQVLALKKTIEGNPKFTNLVFPSSNIIKPENIDFIISFEMK